MPQTYEDVVSDYLARYARAEENYVGFYRNQPNLKTAVSKAAMAEMRDGSKFSHQWRIPPEVLASLRDALFKLNVEKLRSFEDLREAIHNAALSIRGIGVLTIYDTAHRLGAYLGLAPEHVYLHAGTRDGAELLGCRRNQSRIPVSELPAAFHRLTPEHAENCLCIYKDAIALIARRSRK